MHEMCFLFPNSPTQAAVFPFLLSGLPYLNSKCSVFGSFFYLKLSSLFILDNPCMRQTPDTSIMWTQTQRERGEFQKLAWSGFMFAFHLNLIIEPSVWLS